jgi:hypothetical protein
VIAGLDGNEPIDIIERLLPYVRLPVSISAIDFIPEQQED